MVCVQTLACPLYSHVPLSCVPPWTSPVGSNGLTDTLMNCRVMSPSFSEKIFDGTADNRRLHVSMLAAPIGRSAHWLVMSTYPPLDRTTPPSDVLHQMSGFVGWNASSCWSGWIPYGAGTCASDVMSVNVRSLCAGSGSPAVVDRRTARAFERPPSSP